MSTAPRPLTASAVAELVGGRLEGDGALVLSSVNPLDRATDHCLSFLTSSRYLEDFKATRAGAVLVPSSITLPAEPAVVCIVVKDPHAAMAKVVQVMFPEPDRPRTIHPTALIGRGTMLGDDVAIGPGSVIGESCSLGNRVTIGAGVVLEDGVTIGDDSVLHHHIVCYSGTKIGARVRIKSGAVIGGIGFGYISDRSGHHQIPHVGGCIIEDDVHIGANTSIDRGSIGDTVVGRGTKLDNQIHLGHNVQVGERCLLMGGVLVAGSVRIGNDVIVAGASAIAGHLKIGDRARIGAKSGVTTTVPDGSDVSGIPARPHRETLRSQAALFRLAKITDALEALVEREGNHGSADTSAPR